MNKKKLIILSDWYLPGTKAGGPVRSLYSLTELLKNDFEIYLITRHYDLGSEIPYPGIQPDTWLVSEDINCYYCSKDKLSVNHLLAVIQPLNAGVIYINSFWSSYFSIAIVELKNKGKIDHDLILAPRGMLGKGALKIKSLRKKIYLFTAAIRNSYKHVHFHATNEQEKNDICRQFKNAEVTVIPNINSLPVKDLPKTKKSGSLKLFYLSRIVPIKNLDFALNVLKQISGEYHIEYTIYGNIEDDSYWQTCKQLIDTMPSHIRVSYRGELPFHKIADNIGREHCLLLPTGNENFGHSIVESLLCGCPVIISDQTPWNDVQESGAGFALPLKDAEKFKTVVESYARKNNPEFEADVQNARTYISRKINIPLAKEKYIRLFHGKR